MPALMDLTLQPEKIKEAVDAWSEVVIPECLMQGKMAHAKNVMIPLHCGMDNMMSQENYEKYYWPSLKKMIETYVDADITPVVICEGPYDKRIETLTDVPKGKVVYLFENVDMKRAKKMLSDVACIGGGFDTRLLLSGSKERVVEATKRLIDEAASGGGFVMSNSHALDNAERELVSAWYEATMKYGCY
jgi:uroporphyrinogen-III decarboxylase